MLALQSLFMTTEQSGTTLFSAMIVWFFPITAIPAGNSFSGNHAMVIGERYASTPGSPRERAKVMLARLCIPVTLLNHRHLHPFFCLQCSIRNADLMAPVTFAIKNFFTSLGSLISPITFTGAANNLMASAAGLWLYRRFLHLQAVTRLRHPMFSLHWV